MDMLSPPRPVHVLIVDDNPDAAESLALTLRLAGYEVQVAWNGEDALALAKETRPEFVVMDLGMPYMNGFETARRFREDPSIEPAVLIAHTGWGSEEDRLRTKKAGFTFHLVKPADPSELLTLLRRHAVAGLATA